MLKKGNAIHHPILQEGAAGIAGTGQEVHTARGGCRGARVGDKRHHTVGTHPRGDGHRIRVPYLERLPGIVVARSRDVGALGIKDNRHARQSLAQQVHDPRQGLHPGVAHGDGGRAVSRLVAGGKVPDIGLNGGRHDPMSGARIQHGFDDRNRSAYILHAAGGAQLAGKRLQEWVDPDAEHCARLGCNRLQARSPGVMVVHRHLQRLPRTTQTDRPASAPSVPHRREK